MLHLGRDHNSKGWQNVQLPRLPHENFEVQATAQLPQNKATPHPMTIVQALFDFFGRGSNCFMAICAPVTVRVSHHSYVSTCGWGRSFRCLQSKKEHNHHKERLDSTDMACKHFEHYPCSMAPGPGPGCAQQLWMHTSHRDGSEDTTYGSSTA